MKLRLYRHQWEPTGSGDAKSIQNAMGKTSLDLWSMLLRESLQNSWDARRDDHIDFSVADMLLLPTHSANLVHELFWELPPQGASIKLPHQLVNGRLRVLAISDYGTRGLGGPIRANISSTDGEKRDFVDLIRNFGRSQSKGLEGGTYGLGKGVLYSSSQVGMCLIYSQTIVGGAIENRLIGVSGGDPDYDDGGIKFTGRNWWGLLADDNIVDPIQGDQARQIAENVGMPVPEADETGTCIFIISPKEDDGQGNTSSPRDRIEELRQAALLWAWPHAIDLGSGPDVNFEFSYDGVKLPPLRPLEEPLVKHFAQGFVDLVKSQRSGKSPISPQTVIRSIDSERPKKHLGDLALRQALHHPADDRRYQNTVALLRKPKMVVKYLPVTAPVGDYSVYSVFYANNGVDQILASSEPVAHDDWVIRDAQRVGNRNFVRTILNQIEDIFKSLYSESASATASHRVAGATKIATTLGSLISGFRGLGTAVQSSLPAPAGKSGSGNSTSRRPSIRPAGAPLLFKLNSRDHVAFPFATHGGKEGEAYSAIAEARIVLGTGGVENIRSSENNSEGDATQHIFQSGSPQFIGWLKNGDGDFITDLVITTPSNDVYFAAFTQPADTAISAAARLEALQS